MKKKKIKNLAAVAIALFGFAIIGTNVSSGIENPYPAPPPGGGGGGGSYTCYHTWKGTWIGGWHIIDCYTCTQKRVSEFRDKGSCTI